MGMIANRVNLDSAMLHVGTAPQYFIDNLIIESAQNLTRKIHRPVKEPEPVIRKDKPWEHITYFTVSSWRVIRDPVDGLFKCWYEDWKYTEALKPGEDLHEFATKPSRYLYAQSTDGLHWQKPELGIVFENGLSTNIVFGDESFGSVHSGYVMLDERADDPAHRYKIFFDHRAKNLSRYEIASSADGIHWTPWDQLPRLGSFGPHLGDVLTISVDQHAKIYRINTRHPRMCDVSAHPGDPFPNTFNLPVYPEDFTRANRRRIFQAQSSDFVNWTNLQPIVVPDDCLDNIDDSFYGMTQMPLGEGWIGFLHVLHMSENTMDVQLVYSRDGTTFQRVAPGTAWLQPGTQGAWDGLMVNVYGAPVQVGDELYVYYGGSNNHHDWWIVGARENLDVPEANDLALVNYALGLARMKVDRFVSLTATRVRPGVLVTRPLRSAGCTLTINATCRPGGYIKAAITDSQGIPLKGFELADSIAMTGDSVQYTMSWQHHEKIPNAGQAVKVQFFLSDADLFSFRLHDKNQTS